MSGRPKRAVAEKRKATAIALTSDDESDIEEKIKPKRSRKKAAYEEDFGEASTLKKKKRLVKPATTKAKKVKKLSEALDIESIKDTDDDRTDGNVITTTNGLKTSNKKIQSSASQRDVSQHSTNTWTDVELLSELQNIDLRRSSNIIKLFEDDNTIPFICRYRKDMIGNIEADQLRDIKVTYQHIQNIRGRTQTIIKDLAKRNLLNDTIQNELQSARSLDELDHLYAPYKPESKSTLAERAKALGLQDVAEEVLKNPQANIQLENYVNPSTDGLESVEKVTDGIKHIISHIFSKDLKVLEMIRKILVEPHNGIKIQTSASTKSAKISEKSKTTKATTKTGNEAKKKNDKSIDPAKFQIYFDFQVYINQIQSHQILAINRGENLKVLTVKIVIPDRIQFELNKSIRLTYFKERQSLNDRLNLLNAALDEAYNKKLKPLMTRQIRSSLTKMAEKISVEIFAKNLKQLLLLHPVKGKKILGIDPGFKNGCKLALISECMDLLETAVIYPHTNRGNQLAYGKQLGDMLTKYRCDLIALGNGTACRETETWLSNLIQMGILDSNNVRYCIVSENGASIYSCGDIAKKEFPKLDVNLISAVSIARRLSDPLAEFVKVEPKHLGVGMYQHDINEKLLMDSLNEIVMECVSFVGVDLNTASVTLLKHIAGLNATRAENIVKHRLENGPFKCRNELKKVKSVGDKTFTQCAGFVRIEPLTANTTKYNALDSTWVHPESYDVAERIMKKLNFTTKGIGTKNCISRVKEFSENQLALTDLAKEFKIPEERVQTVLVALSRELFQDYRDDADIKPLFKQGLQRMSDLKVGIVVTGAISNITTFGYFVDIGIECDGLIHVSQLNGKTANIGDCVKTRVLNLDVARKRIQLRLEEIL